ncbi:MAG: hypothetical protein KDG54_14515 [Geminicoccaceae bacterium]|nr:hypothetical protein [Geminicoccaceae bacterium]
MNPVDRQQGDLKAEVVRSLRAASMLVRLQPDGLRCFNLTIEGFWRSFLSAAIVFPGAIFIFYVQNVQAGNPVTFENLARTSLIFVLSWLKFPLLSLAFVRFFKLGDRYLPLIIASNWVSACVMAIFIAVLLVTSLIPPALGQLLLLFAFVGALYVQWFVLKVALRAPAVTVLGLFTLDLLVEEVIHQLLAG